MKRYRKVSEFERHLNEIKGIKTEDQLKIVQRGIEAAYSNERLNHTQYQTLLRNLLKRSEEMRLYNESVRNAENL